MGAVNHKKIVVADLAAGHIFTADCPYFAENRIVLFGGCLPMREVRSLAAWALLKCTFLAWVRIVDLAFKRLLFMCTACYTSSGKLIKFFTSCAVVILDILTVICLRVRRVVRFSFRSLYASRSAMVAQVVKVARRITKP
jgi:hypothetical protein